MSTSFHPEIERQPLSVIEAFQQKKLAELLEYLSLRSPYYARLFKQEKIDIKKIKLLSDLKHIPFTAKEDLQLHNDDFLCVPKAEIIDYITTSGTLSDLLLPLP